MKIKLSATGSNVHSLRDEFKLKLWNPDSWHVRIFLNFNCDIGLNDDKVAYIKDEFFGRSGQELV